MSDGIISRLANCRGFGRHRLPASEVAAINDAIAEIARLTAERDSFKQALHDEMDSNLRLRELGGARPEEGMTPFLERVFAERDALFDQVGRLTLHRTDLANKFRSAEQQFDALAAELAAMTERKDAAYLERNQVVAALAKAFPSGIARTAIEGWSDDWHWCVYIDLPTGQASWHFHDSQAYLFAGLPPYQGKWDGHDTPEKYRRLAELAAARAQEPDWRHPKIQSLIGGKARREIELLMAEALLDDPAYEITGMDGDYWGTIHDKIVALQSAAPDDARDAALRQARDALRRGGSASAFRVKDAIAAWNRRAADGDGETKAI